MGHLEMIGTIVHQLTRNLSMEEIQKGVQKKLAEAEARYKDLENNFFDLQMENIRIKSELEKLRGGMK